MAKRSRTALERAEQTARLRARPARAQMLAAARELATAKGYESIKAGDIAQAAGVSRETFYTHFADKRSCLAEATEPRLGEIESELRIAAEEDESWAAPILASLEATLLERYGSKSSPRGRIIEAMLGLVAEHGYASVRLADVIKEAHVSHPSFYRHFKSKEQCFEAACESLVQRLADDLRVTLEADSTDRHRLEVLADLLSSAPEAVRILILEGSVISPAGWCNADGRSGGYAELITGGRRRADGAHLALRVGAFTELLRRAALSGRLDDLPGQAATLVEMLAPRASAEQAAVVPPRPHARAQRRGTAMRNRAGEPAAVSR